MEIITSGIQGLVIKQKDQLTGLYVTDTLGVTSFLPRSLHDFTNNDFIKVVPKNTSNKLF